MTNIRFFPGGNKARRRFLWACLILPALARSQATYVAGARATALAGCSVALVDHRWAGVTNWSGCARLSDLTVSFAAMPAPFGLPELRTGAVSVDVPFSGGGTGLLVERLGGDLYKRISVATGFGVDVGGQVAVGAGLSWRHESYERYGTASNVCLDAGWTASLMEGVSLGSSFTALATIAGDPDVMPARTARLGISWEPNERMRLNAEAQKDVRWALSLCAGIEYSASDDVVLRGGIGDEPSRSAFGCTVRLGPVRVSYAAAIHSELGWTHLVEVEIALEKER